MRKGKAIVFSIVFIAILLVASVFLFKNALNKDQVVEKEEKDSFIENIFKSDKTEEKEQNEETTVVDNSARIAEIDATLKALVLVNPDHGLNEDYEPELTDLPTKFGVTFAGEAYEMTPEAAKQLEKMLEDAKAEGHNIIIYSAYRSYARQKTNYLNKVNEYLNKGYSQSTAEEQAATIVNPPGKSEHQSGLSADICTAEMIAIYGSLPQEFAETDEYEWLLEHCAEYGFILRYPKDKEKETGITFEPWHYRYVGVEYAEDIMNSGLCLEEYVANLEKEKSELSK